MNSVNPFRIEGQKSIAIEMMDQRDWVVPDWVVLPGGNLGNVSALGKAFDEMKRGGFIDRLPKIGVIQAAGSSPFFSYMGSANPAFVPDGHPETLATAIKIGDPVSWPKALKAITESGGWVESVTEQEIADAKAVIGQCGIGCEPASAASLAGAKKLVGSGHIQPGDDVVGILTGNVLKDPDYIYRYHTGQLKDPAGGLLTSTFGNAPTVVPNDVERIMELLAAR